MKIPTPSFGKLQHALRETLRHFRKIADDATGPTIEVRVCMREDGSWNVVEGDVSYDTEHTAFCASGALHVSMVDPEIDDLVRDMISDLADQVAESEAY